MMSQDKHSNQSAGSHGGDLPASQIPQLAERKEDDWGHGFEEEEEALEEIDSEEEDGGDYPYVVEEAESEQAVQDAKDEGSTRDGSGSSDLKGLSGGAVSPLQLGALSQSAASESSLQQRISKRTSSGNRLGTLKLGILPPRRSSENLRAAADRCGSPMLASIEVVAAGGDGVDFAPRLVTPRADAESIPSKNVETRWSAPWELKEQDA